MSNEIIKRQKEELFRIQQLLQKEVPSEKLKREIDLVQVFRSLESNVFSTNFLWRVTSDGIVEYNRGMQFENSNKEKATRLHLIYPMLYSLVEYGGHFDYELVGRLRKPLFMINHALKILSEGQDKCPFYLTDKYRDCECVSFDKQLVDWIKLEGEPEEDIMISLRYGCEVDNIGEEYEVKLPTREVIYTKNFSLSANDLKKIKSSWRKYKLSIQ